MQATERVVRKVVEVEAPIARAWTVFTDGIATWWPVGTHSIGEDRVSDVVMEPRVGGLLYEVLDDGGRHEWADVEAFEALERLRLRWRVNPQRAATTVEVRFTALDADRTRVELTHSGFDTAASHESYETGWDPVMAGFAAAAARA